MINEILEYQDFPFVFKILKEKNKFTKYGGKLTEFWNNKTEISKNEVITIIKEDRLSNKDQFIAILFWGVYFSSIKTKETAYKLISFFNSEEFENTFENYKTTIIESNSPSELFNIFQDEKKIPGIDYAYFTKLFFFYRVANNKEPYLILDKWMSMAWSAIDGYQHNNTVIFDRFYRSKTNCFFDGVIKRKKADAYSEYLEFMKQLSASKNVNIVKLEEKLFGADRGIYTQNNPRNLYREWANNNHIPLTRPQTNNSSKPQLIEFRFYIKQTKQYLGLYTDEHFKNKEGYIDNNGWLCVSELLKDKINIPNINWISGNTKGGSKEKYKTKFMNQEDCFNLIINHIEII